MRRQAPIPSCIAHPLPLSQVHSQLGPDNGSVAVYILRWPPARWSHPRHTSYLSQQAVAPHHGAWAVGSGSAKQANLLLLVMALVQRDCEAELFVVGDLMRRWSLKRMLQGVGNDNRATLYGQSCALGGVSPAHKATHSLAVPRSHRHRLIKSGDSTRPAVRRLLHACYMNAVEQQPLAQQVLVDEGDRTVGADAAGNTALHVAAAVGATGIAFDLVCFYGASVDARNTAGMTPLELATASTTHRVPVDLRKLLEGVAKGTWAWWYWR